MGIFPGFFDVDGDTGMMDESASVSAISVVDIRGGVQVAFAVCALVGIDDEPRNDDDDARWWLVGFS
jgi:hypothetical protein